MQQGAPLRINPEWVRWTYGLLVVVFATALLFLVVTRVPEYAAGTAVVRSRGRAVVTAPVGGTVTSVEVLPHQIVSAGQLLAKLYDGQEEAEYHRTHRQFELTLIEFLKDPNNGELRKSLAALRTQKEAAEARVRQRALIAPLDGLVSDVRIRPGDHLAPGDIALTVVERDSGFAVLAALPGFFRPLLKQGMPARLEFEGYPYAAQRLTLETIGDEVVGSEEVRRFLGVTTPESGLSPNVVLVRSEIPSATFFANGREHRLHEGMRGRLEVKVRTEHLAFVLIPGLKALVEGSPDE
jgi:multidrug resistance efflux pump